MARTRSARIVESQIVVSSTAASAVGVKKMILVLSMETYVPQGPNASDVYRAVRAFGDHERDLAFLIRLYQTTVMASVAESDLCGEEADMASRVWVPCCNSNSKVFYY